MNFIDFILWSSKNPQKISLTIKAGVPFIASVVAMFGLNIDVNPIADQLVLVINTALLLVTGIATLWGLLRKAYRTWKGENKVIE